MTIAAPTTLPHSQQLTWMRRLPVASLMVIAGLMFLALFAPLIAPHDPEAVNLALRYRPPVWQDLGTSGYLLGTDHLGRDMLSRLIFGTRVSLVVGLTVVLIVAAVGTALGIIAGYFGGWVDQVIMRFTDTWMALPGITIAIFLAALLGPGEANIVIVLSAVYWTRVARVIRAEVLSLRERDFVRLAIVAGCGPWVIMWRHILPNIANTAVVLATLMLGMVVVTEASLSFLGLGVPPPKPAWGLMLADGKRGLMAGYWWLTVLPGLFIMVLVLAANLFGDWLRDRLNPHVEML